METYTTPVTATTNANVTAYGNTAYGTATTTYYGGQTLVFEKPRASNTILCFTERPNVNGLVYDAAFLGNSLRGKYGMATARQQVAAPRDPVTTFVCGNSPFPCNDPRVPRMRELVAQGMSLQEAYAEASEPAAGSASQAPESNVAAAQSGQNAETATTSQPPMDSHLNTQTETRPGECEYMILKRAFPFRMVPVCVDEQTWEKNPARRVPVKPRQ